MVGITEPSIPSHRNTEYGNLLIVFQYILCSKKTLIPAFLSICGSEAGNPKVSGNQPISVTMPNSLNRNLCP